MHGTVTEVQPGRIDASFDSIAGNLALVEEFENLQRRLAQAETEAQDVAAILELIGKLQLSENLRDGCYTLVNELKEHLNCGRVALGLRTRDSGPCQLIAVSGLARFDKRSEATQLFESAFDEAVLKGDPTNRPAVDEADRHSSLSLNKLCAHESIRHAFCTPLRDDRGDVVGACMFELPETEEDDCRKINLIKTLERPIGTILAMLKRLERGPIARTVRLVGNAARTNKGRVAIIVFGILLGSLALPITHKVDCECRLEPVTRRFVAAPFDGTLQESAVKPGDLVSQGDLLARLDGREIRWERAGLVADQKQAAKKRDSELAAHNFAAAQIAKLEIERLGLQIQLLDHRESHLEITSPIDGVVTSGDLERTVGAPVTIGQTLFEVAPLEKIIVEIAVPQEDVSYVDERMEIETRLDSHPGKVWKLRFEKMHPRSEIRDNANVFIAEAVLDNHDKSLRPGMDGRAKIISSRKSLGWILFHKPWESLLMWLGW